MFHFLVIQRSLIAVMKRRPVFAAVVVCSVLSIILLATIYQPWQYIDYFPDSLTRDLNWIATGAPRNAIKLDDLTITLKTTKRFHQKRISVLLRTWVKFVLNQVRGV